MGDYNDRNKTKNKNHYNEVYNVLKTEFATAEHNHGNEHDLVEVLRKGNNFIPNLSLVAIEDNKIDGYIVFTKIRIGKEEEITVAPLAVLSQYQRKAIRRKLIEIDHKIAKELGYHYHVLLGSEDYYPKFDYVPAIKYGIKAPFNVANENFMAIKLNDTHIKIEGLIYTTFSILSNFS